MSVARSYCRAMNRSTRSFSEHLDHLRSLADLEAGDRIIVPVSGRTGTIVKKNVRHNGYRVRWDEPMFGVEEGDVQPSNMERIKP